MRLFEWDESDGLTGWLTTQRPHIDRLALSDILEIPAEQVRIIAPRDQGGGFGVKAPFYREPMLIAYMAKKLGRPIRWIETRQEHLMAVSQERDQIHDLEVAAASDGKLLAIRDRGLADCGDGCEGVYWGFLMPFLGAVELPNAYDWPIGDIKVKVAITNKSALSPARAFGEFPTRFAMERAIDMVAKRCGLEPADVRRKNLVASLPPHVDHQRVFRQRRLHQGMGQPDGGGRPAGLPRAPDGGAGPGAAISASASASAWSSRASPPSCSCRWRTSRATALRPCGSTRAARWLVFEGDAPGGQGHETTVAQAVAHSFGIHPNDVVVTTGDTGTTPFGSGTVGARAGSYFVSAAVQACEFLKEKIARIMAHDLALADASPADFSFADGFVTYSKDANIKKTFREAVERVIMAPINLPEGESGGLEHTAFFEAEKPMIAFNADVCTVEVDVETGQFKILSWTTSEDVGQIINPQIVEGQMQGAIVQGAVEHHVRGVRL